MKVLRGGCATRHDASFFLSRPQGLENHVILLLRSKGEFWINNKQYLLNPGHTIIIAPRTQYRYHDPDGRYSDDFLHFQLDNGEAIPDSLQCNIPFILNDLETCSTLIRLLLWEQAYTPPIYAESDINALFSVLCNHLVVAYQLLDNIESISPYLQKFKQLRLQLQNTPTQDHSISKHAAELAISASHFQHIYSQLFGISFQKDLIHMRISYAEMLLQTTDLSVEQIAEHSGYTNSAHFFRQFKQIKGVTPAKYRKTNLIIDG